MDDLKQFVLANVKPDDYYQSIFPKWSPLNKANQRCFWHEDSGQPNLSVGLNNGGAKCHKCDKRIGNIVHFEAERLEISETEAAKNIYGKFVRKIVGREIIRQFERQLNQKSINWIEQDCGLTERSIEKFRLGIDNSNNRITIPIQDRFKNHTNVRFYALPRHRTKDTTAKLYNYKNGNGAGSEGGTSRGYGYLELFPWQEILKYTPLKPLFMMKAEKDTMLAIQDGLQAFCVTNGELAWDNSWNELFKEYEIGVCLDDDETGRKASEKKIAILQGNCRFVSKVTIPFSSKSKQLKDYADWVILDNGSGKKLLEIWKEKRAKAKLVIPPSEVKPKLPEYYSDEYCNIVDIGRNSDMLNLIVKVKGIVSAKTDKTYTIPYKFYVSSTSSPKRVWTIPFGRELLRLIKSSDDRIIEFIKHDLLQHHENSQLDIEPIEYITVTEVEIIPVASVESDAPYVTQKCFYFGNHIDANVPYHLDIIPTTEIRTQETVGIIVACKSITSSIDSFIFNNETTGQLEGFRVKEGKVWQELCNIANSIAAQFTPIRGRTDWHIVALLSWACPLQFDFPNEGRQRGWMNTLCLGDTETGKSKVTQALQKLFNCGSFVNAENCTYVGLVGGAVKTSSGQFMLRWGRIPLCNRQLVVIEELSGIPIEQIANMSEVRSSGIARLDKGGLSGETSSKTRLIFLSNVRGREKNLADYTSGVKAIQDLIGHGEDIARFDFIVTLTNKEVPAHIINANLYEQDKIATLQPERLKLLMQFIWALKPEQIKFTKEAYLSTLDIVQEMGLKYHASCHIFQASSGRLKLARIATAIACFQFSWHDNQINVRPEHVQAASKILQLLYDKESFGYAVFSEQLNYRDSIRSVEYLESTCSSVLGSHERCMATFRYFVHVGRFTRDELCSVASIQIIQADQLIGRMVASNLLRKGVANVWEVTTIGLKWISTKLLEDKPKKVATLQKEDRPKEKEINDKSRWFG